jgi:hypothetical protein
MNTMYDKKRKLIMSQSCGYPWHAPLQACYDTDFAKYPCSSRADAQSLSLSLQSLSSQIFNLSLLNGLTKGLIYKLVQHMQVMQLMIIVA